MTSVRAQDLTLDSLPDWLHTTELAKKRMNGRMGKTGTALDWRFLVGLAIDESGLKAPHRSVLRVLVSFDPGSSWPMREIGRRAGVSHPNMRRLVDDLEADGWVWVDRVKGGKVGHRWTVMVPVEAPPDRVAAPAKGHRRKDPNPINLITQPDQLDHLPDQLDHTTRSSRYPRFHKGPGVDEGSNQRVAPSKFDDAIDPRWLQLVRKIEDDTPEITTAKDRSAIADVIADRHGLGTLEHEPETIDAILTGVRELVTAGAPPLTALAKTMHIPLSDIAEHRRNRHEARTA